MFLLVVRDYKTVALPSKDATGGTHRLSARAVVAELLRPRTALVTCIGAGLNLLVVSTTYAWLPSYLNRYYGLAPDQAGLKTGIVVLVGGVGALVWSAVADRLTLTDSRAHGLIVPAVAAVLTTVFMCAAFAGVAAGQRCSSLLIVAGGFVMAGSVGPTDAVVIDVIHPALRATGGLGPVAHAEPVRARRRPAARRRAVRCLRIAVRDGRGAGVLPGRGRACSCWPRGPTKPTARASAASSRRSTRTGLDPQPA